MNAPFILRIILTIYIVLMILLSWIFTFLIQVIITIFSYPFLTEAQRCDGCGSIFRFVSFVFVDLLNPFWNAKTLRPFPEVKGKKVLLMMNHLSNADPFLVVRSMLPRDATWIAKDELFRVPFGGWCMYFADDLRVCFKDKKSGFETVKGTVGVMMEQAREKLQRGRMIAIFPEGIRNKHPEGDLSPFRIGFFTLAVEEGATIVPLAMSGTEGCWPRGAPLMDVAGAYLSYGEPIDASKFKSAEELRDHVWQVLSGIRNSHPDRLAKKEKKINE